MVTREEIEGLKRDWRSDPCWDLEGSEGFEDHHEELLAFRKKMETIWRKEREARENAELEAIKEEAHALGCTPAMLRYIRTLEARINDLEIDLS